MPVSLTPIKGAAQLARVYEGAADGMPPIDCVFLLEWESARVAWIRGAHGKFSRRTLREVLQLIVSLGIHTILAERADGHVLPGVTHVDDAGVHHIDVVALSHRFARPGASDWADL